MKNIKKNWLIIIASLIVGISIGVFLHAPQGQAPQKLQGKPVRLPDPSFPLINPLLGYDNAESTNFGQLVDFKKKLSELVGQEVNQTDVSKISVYFRDLNVGRWVGINTEETYDPASLLKVPLMIAYYHISESDPSILSKQIIFDSSEDLNKEQTIAPSHKLEFGKSYSVDQLINRMIIYSDNDFTQLLFKNIDQKILAKTFSDMDILLPTSGGAQDFISVKNYALFIRVLYGSTYLSHANSEKALELLGKSEFKDGIVAGVQKDTTVAHKFGEYGLLDQITQKITQREFHDCGIVYYSEKPYLLCVMTRGSDLTKLEKAVSDISKLVYTEVDTGDN